MVLLKGKFMQDSNSQNNPQTTPSPAPTPQAPGNIYPPAGRQAPTPTMAGTQVNVPTMNEPTKKSSPIPKIIIAVVLVIILVVGGIFLIKHLSKGPKTMAEFERIMTDLGYAPGQDDVYHYTDTDGAYTIYFMTNLTTDVGGMALFYDVNSKDDLRDLVESNSQGDSALGGYIKSFDWSKDYNKEGDCYTNDGDAKICQYLIQYDNTLLSLFITSNSIDESKAEVDRVLSALNY